MAFAKIDIKPIFATPFVKASFDPAKSETLNQELSELIMRKATEERGVSISNSRGWQSDDKLLEWGGQPVTTLLDALRVFLNQITMCADGKEFKRIPIDWRINGWANINHEGDANVPHVHPGAYWSIVYYVATPKGGGEKGEKGELELFDPRGMMPLLLAPHLSFAIDQYQHAGSSQFYEPKEGQCIIFPSWLRHGVRPFREKGTRISLAFNFSVY